ncbi:MAG: hypothetical protein ACT4R6_05435 [Gemmatimonadaceae bacterium]
MRLSLLGTPALLVNESERALEPRLAALLSVLAVAGDAGVEADDLMVLLTPDATPNQARNELDRLLALARHETGDEMLIVHPGTRYVLRRDAIALDVDILPDDGSADCPAFLSDVDLPDCPEFADWLGAARRRVRPKSHTESAAPSYPTDRGAGLPNERRSNRRWRVPALLGLFLAAAGVASWVRVARSRPVAGFKQGDPVLLADIANETGDTLFDQGILTAASVALQQSGHLRLYPRTRLPAVYQRMQIANRDTALSYELAQEVAQRDNVRFALGLRLFRDAGGYRITARLADVVLGEEVSENSEAAERESDVIAALGRVLLSVRQRLGETRAEIRERQAPLPLVTTASIEALRSFAEGRVAWRDGQFPVAHELWRRAVDLDTGFASALGALGGWHYHHHNREEGDRYYAEALRRSARLTEWERLHLLAGLAGYRGNQDSSLALSKVIATRFPNVDTWYGYGTHLMQSGRDEEAIKALQTGLTFDSLHVNSYINLATAAKGLKRYEDALRNYRKASELDSATMYRNNINHEWGGTYVLLGRIQEAERVYQGMLGSARLQDRALGMRSMGYLALWQGQLGRAIDFFSQATDATAQLKSVLGEARNHMLLAAALRAADRTPEANVQVSRALALTSSKLIPPQALVFVAFGCIRLGRIADADSMLRLIRSRVSSENIRDRDSERLVAAALHVARQQPDSALALLGSAMPHSPGAYVMALRAEAFLALGARDSARATLEQMIREPVFGFEGQEEFQNAPVTLGTLLEAQGDSSGARAAYRRYLERWRDAPAALPRVAAARGRLAALGGSQQP